jgi:hypothetical protein
VHCRVQCSKPERAAVNRSSRWTPEDDALFRSPEIIATKLIRSVHAIKARAYTIGLPLKWIKLKAKGEIGQHHCCCLRCMPGNYRTSGALTPATQQLAGWVSVGRDLNCGIGAAVALWTRRRSCCGRSTE